MFALTHVHEDAQGAGPSVSVEAAGALLVAWKDGDATAFDALVQHFHGMVYRVAHALLRHREDTEDAVQETFWRFYRAGQSIRNPLLVKPWLYRTVVNVSRTMRKRSQKAAEASSWQGTPGEAAGEGGAVRDGADRADTAPSIEDELALQAVLASALELLSTKEREVMVLRDIEGLEVNEVAKALGVFPVTVRSHLSNGRLKLRAALRRMGVRP
jgi:RNA polymerase sigma-70 factor (ECF subfamily)